jgi:hypothetical protein
LLILSEKSPGDFVKKAQKSLYIDMLKAKGK